MQIGELAARTGVSERSLRYYERLGLLHAERRSNGYRDFADAAAGDVAKIRALLDVGFSTETIKTLLPCVEEGTRGFVLCDEVVELVERHLARSDAEIGRLRRQRAELANYLGASS
ncbi:MerR family transcriptional regulator [Phytoactinopolyspora limicola]|uniref:MerR family transcriptional regulator n=1 Tax=Phytoactinopolyspora limicola TaxID=2715536 RepID=UPI00140D91DA|nr:MerR family transcriptional regulator [Phytoactinopolyspora limicola]